jgi:hypothetical protein
MAEQNHRSELIARQEAEARAEKAENELVEKVAEVEGVAEARVRITLIHIEIAVMEIGGGGGGGGGGEGENYNMRIVVRDCGRKCDRMNYCDRIGNCDGNRQLPKNSFLTRV